ncbi:MAG: ATP-dependent sacrificial sulfur transferase LarE [Phycisphaerae bacterium]|nr:ATP-dependent sacrificial sulfur transferase LarE [Phycisphaerae bacterium]
MTPSETTSTNPNLTERLERCREILRSLGGVVVAVSGGVDSSLLLALAVEVLGKDNVLAATAAGLIHPAEETQAAGTLAESLGVELVEIDTTQLLDQRVLDNPADRCYWCKRLLFGQLLELAQRRGLSAVASGSNAADAGEHRPGARAEEELDIACPLRDAGMTKSDIRQAAREMGLGSWDRPSRACLASRVPYGRPLDAETLRRIELVESALRAMGFTQYRCRDHDTVARLELLHDEIPLALHRREQILQTAKAAGYVYVTLDLEGFRSGSMDETG